MSKYLKFKHSYSPLYNTLILILIYTTKKLYNLRAADNTRLKVPFENVINTYYTISLPSLVQRLQ